MAVAVKALPVIRACDMETTSPEARWLVRNFWPRQGVGIIGGQPKLGKSWLGLDLAISVASGTSCLGYFPVTQTGPTLVFLAEDGLSEVRARIEAICTHRGLDIKKLDLHVITAPVLRLDVDEQRQQLQATLEVIKPRLLLLDPLVRLHRLDENSSQDVSLLLGFLREMQRACDLSIALVHHASKKQRGRPGQSLRGSSDLHAFVDTLAWLGGTREKLEFQLEHRSASSPDPMRLRLVSGAKGNDTHLELVDARARSAGGPHDGVAREDHGCPWPGRPPHASGTTTGDAPCQQPAPWRGPRANGERPPRHPGQ